MAEVLNLGIGAGTNSSEVFDLNTPNPFAISQDYMNKAIAMREKSLARDVENEKERQERLDDFLSKVDSIDPKWANANLELNNEINKYGDQISEYRAQGKPLTKEFYKQINQAQRSIKDKAAINEKNFTKYSQIMSEMASHPELYSREDVDAFENQITKAYEKEDGGIIAAEPILSSWQKIIGPINVVESYVKGNFLPQSKDKTGYLKATDEKDFKNSISSYWDSLTMPQRKKIYEQYARDGRLDTDQVAGVEGQVDQDVMKKLIEEDVRPKMEYDKTPPAMRSGGGSGSGNEFNKDVPSITPGRRWETTAQGGGKYDTYALNVPAPMVLSDANGNKMGVQSGAATVEMVSEGVWGDLPAGVYLSSRIDPKGFPEIIKKTEAEAKAEADRLTRQTGGAKFVVSEIERGKFKVMVDETNNIGHFPLNRTNNTVLQNSTTRQGKGGFDVLGMFEKDNGQQWVKNNNDLFWGSYGSGGSGGQGNQQTSQQSTGGASKFDKKKEKK